MNALPLEHSLAGIPFDDIPAALAYLSARLVRERRTVTHAEPEPTNQLLDAKALGERLEVPETHVREQARQGRIPSIRVGRYVRFDEAAVRAALGKKTV